MFQAIKGNKSIPVRRWMTWLLGTLLSLGLGYLFFAGSHTSQLIGFLAYMSVSCALLPLPAPPYVIALGTLFDPSLVAFLGALGNCIAAFGEYHLISWLFSKRELRQRVETNGNYRKFAAYFQRAVFPCLLFSALVPIPLEPFRLAAIMMRYNLTRYLLAVFIGRFPRYYVMALIGDYFLISNRYLAVMLVAMLVFPLIALWITGKSNK